MSDSAEEGRPFADQARLRMVTGDALHLALRAEDERHTLVQRFRGKAKNAFDSVGRGPSRLLDKKGDRICLVDEP